jgi:hypothetical protein
MKDYYNACIWSYDFKGKSAPLESNRDQQRRELGDTKFGQSMYTMA